MPRIVGGTAGGRTIAVPRGDATRPTTDRVREALFSSLGDLTGLRVLDGYAGSGALGLEALSRGAEHALLVERSAVAVRVLRANVAALGLPGAAVHAGPLLPLLGRGPAGAYDLVLLDPPYDQDVEADLHALVDLRWLAPAAELVLERATRSPEPRWPAGLGDGAARARRYGETTLWYLRAP
jgi:16S rRNA (guanine966-N2)-methyltransferase